MSSSILTKGTAPPGCSGARVPSSIKTRSTATSGIMSAFEQLRNAVDLVDLVDLVDDNPGVNITVANSQ
jgi:hypothetical protein